MKTAEYINNSINRMPKGHVFTYSDFIKEVSRREAIIKTLNRMAASGKIVKLAKGKYYKPEETVFGKLRPNQNQIVKDLLESNGKISGYLTGYSIYNQLGLTTQVSNTIQIGKNEIRASFKRERYTISFIKQKNTITKDNIPLLQILDAIRYIKKIPDATIALACKRLLTIIEKQSRRDIVALVRLAQKYPPAARALLGALLETAEKKSLAEPLFNSLNHITQYKFLGIEKALPCATKWYIK